MIRELIVVTADLTATPWFASGTAPRPTLAPDLTLRTITETHDAARFAGDPVNADVAEARLAAGDCCIAVEHSTGMLAAQLWLTTQARHLDWIGCAVAPEPDTVLLYNAWVDPAHRGRDSHWAMAGLACETVAKMGFGKISAGVERHEFEPFARKYADMGLAVIVPVASLWCLRSKGWHVRLRPPRILRDFSASLSCA